MKVSEILNHIDSGHMGLPTFQRGYVWNRKQVRQLMDSLYQGLPVGSLLVWVTPSDNVSHRGSQDLAPGAVQLLLDGQQRITSLYGIIRGKPPAFFDGDAKAVTDLYFHLANEEFQFYQPSVMKKDPLWLDVTDLMQRGNAGMSERYVRLMNVPEFADHMFGRINQILAIGETSLHEDKITGDNKTVEVVVDIFDRVNSKGTTLSQGDLALAKICASWPGGREVMKAKLEGWKDYNFNLTWLLRNVNAIMTGEARFVHLHDKGTQDIQNGLARAERSIDYALNLIADRLGLDHDKVISAPNALPVMSRYIDQRGGNIANGRERDRLLYWYFQSARLGHFSSGSIDSRLDEDFEAIKENDGAIDRLIANLHLQHNLQHNFGIDPDHFSGSNVNNRYVSVLYALTRIGEARDWSDPYPVLKKHLLGRMSRLELHHIFPKSRLKSRYARSEVNAVANFCFLTKETNLKIGAQLPSEYFREIMDKDPDALKSQWIPTDDEKLWEIENYPQFLEARRKLLADATNELLSSLLHDTVAPATAPTIVPVSQPVVDGPEGGEIEDEEAILNDLKEWVVGHSLAEGQVDYELEHRETGERLARLDLAWPDGLQEGLTDPVALLLDAEAATLKVVVNDHRFRPFTSVDAFKRYVETDVLET